MCNGQAASYVRYSPDRPKYVRYTSDPSGCCRSPRKRKDSGDTHGNVYISAKDSKHKRSNRRRKHACSTPTSPLSLPVLERSVPRSDSCSLHQDGVIEDKGRTNWFPFADESPDPDLSVVRAIQKEVSQHPGIRTDSIYSALSSPSTLTPQSTGALPRPYYVSSGGLNLEPGSYVLNDRDRSASFPYLGPVKRNFLSLADEDGDEYDQSREDLTSSVSSYLRPNAFLGHRDTLARIRHGSTTSGSSSASLMLYPSSTIPSIPSSLLTRHRDTFARINYRRRPALPVPNAVFQGLLKYLTFDDYKALRLTCRVWLPSLPPPQLPAAYRIPSELLQQVYSFLSLLDFDAARHTCRSWFVASLERRLLEIMSRRAGCYGSTQVDLLIRHDYYDERRRSMNGRMWAEHDIAGIDDYHQPEADDLVSEEWVYSKRLAIESMLSPQWKGTSFKHRSAPPGDERCPMTSIGTVEFSFVSERQCRSVDAPIRMPGDGFTVSGCGKFGLITSDRVVFVCELLRRNPGIQPLTRIVCHRKVLGVSMDTSSKRYAVAILLDGRLGLCCSLTDGFGDALSETAMHGESMQLGMSADVRGSDSVAVGGKPTVSALPLRRAEVVSSLPSGQFYVTRASEDFISPASNRAAEAGPDSSWIDEPFGAHRPREEHADSEQDATSKSGVPIEDGARAVYKNLCSVDDPPRSVAICPQRRCVAFGCRMGIELHWVDALTGGDLKRWFPLAAPSDYLYFLPAREVIDSAKKLRLISSAAGPYAQQQKTTFSRGGLPPRMNWRTNPAGSKRQSMTTLFSDSLPIPMAMASSGKPNATDQRANSSPRYQEYNHGVSRTVDCDHYRAVPLSDGAHLLFTDPATGRLCLGSDAPLGGPTKLLRKVVCLPPDVEDTGYDPEEYELPEQSPSQPWLTCYTAGQDLRWGVRIVAAYDDGRIMLYCVPPDVFEIMRSTKTGVDVWDERAGLIGQSDLLMDLLMQRDRPQPNTKTPAHAGNDASVLVDDVMDISCLKSLALQGIEIGRASGQMVDDIAVSCDWGGLRVWAFLQSGLVRMWTLLRMDGGREGTWIIGKDGIVRNKEEAARMYKDIANATMNRPGPPRNEPPASSAIMDPFKSGEVSGKKGKGKEWSSSPGQDGGKAQHIRFAGSGLDGAAEEGHRRGRFRQNILFGLSSEGNCGRPTHHSFTPPLVRESPTWARHFEPICEPSQRKEAQQRLQITILSDWCGMLLPDLFAILLE